jgi:Delta7-sterol 5-desaturase
MEIWATFQRLVVGDNPLFRWLFLFIIGGLVVTVFQSFFRARKIQPNGFRWKTFRNEIFFGILNVATGGAVVGWLIKTFTAHGWIAVNHAPAAWWVVGLEYALYFFAFDTWFYWLHRLMHIEPIYKWVHKLHHYSVSPNLVTTLSVSPFESVVNGGFVPLFLAVMTVHASTMALITPTNIIMGIYVHCGYEFFPRWWQRSWFTKWFITTTFHDQHHRYFNWNYGGYTTIWDWICGTVRPKFVADYEQIKARLDKPMAPAAALVADPPNR